MNNTKKLQVILIDRPRANTELTMDDKLVRARTNIAKALTDAEKSKAALFDHPKHGIGVRIPYGNAYLRRGKQYIFVPLVNYAPTQYEDGKKEVADLVLAGEFDDAINPLLAANITAANKRVAKRTQTA